MYQTGIKFPGAFQEGRARTLPELCLGLLQEVELAGNKGAEAGPLHQALLPD